MWPVFLMSICQLRCHVVPSIGAQENIQKSTGRRRFTGKPGKKRNSERRPSFQLVFKLDGQIISLSSSWMVASVSAGWWSKLPVSVKMANGEWPRNAIFNWHRPRCLSLPGHSDEHYFNTAVVHGCTAFAVAVHHCCPLFDPFFHSVTVCVCVTSTSRQRNPNFIRITLNI